MFVFFWVQVKLKVLALKRSQASGNIREKNKGTESVKVRALWKAASFNSSVDDVCWTNFLAASYGPET
jgi:hypothetical protein